MRKFRIVENSLSGKSDFQVKAVKISLIQSPIALDARQERQDERQERQDEYKTDYRSIF
jgi:hypothetical protein